MYLSQLGILKLSSFHLEQLNNKSHVYSKTVLLLQLTFEYSFKTKSVKEQYLERFIKPKSSLHSSKTNSVNTHFSKTFNTKFELVDVLLIIPKALTKV